MKCPHCQISVHVKLVESIVGEDVDGRWTLLVDTCPSCQRLIVYIKRYYIEAGKPVTAPLSNEIYLTRPRISIRPAPPKEVPPEFAQDYIEASLVIADSPKASAALSRRCLQLILLEKAGVKQKDLAKQLDEVLAQKSLPSHLANDIDAIRHVGNFAAHPMKSESTGEIVPVEPGEAEWTLDVLDRLFDFYFVQPELSQRKRDELNAKLKDAGKPPLKS